MQLNWRERLNESFRQNHDRPNDSHQKRAFHLGGFHQKRPTVHLDDFLAPFENPQRPFMGNGRSGANQLPKTKDLEQKDSKKATKAAAPEHRQVLERERTRVLRFFD